MTDQDHKFNLIVPKEMYEHLRKMAYENRQPIAEIIREAVDRYIKDKGKGGK